MNLTDAIKQYLKLGLSLIPIKPGTKQPLVEWDEFKVSRADGKQWSAWWRSFAGKVGVAVVYSSCATDLGKQLVCVDTDTPEAEAWVLEQEEYRPTVTAQTSKGFHRYYLAPAGLPHFGGDSQRGLPEIRAGEHYSILPPSVHPDGTEYRWLDGCAFGECDVADLPEWGCELMRGKQDAAETPPVRAQAAGGTATSKYGASALGQEIAAVSRAATGERNNALNAAAYALGQLVGGGVLEESDVRAALIGACHGNGLIKDDGLRAVECTLNSGLSKGMQSPRSAPQREASRTGGQATQVAPPEQDAEYLDALIADAERSVNGLIAQPLTAEDVTPTPLAEIAVEAAQAMEEYRTRDRVVRGFRTGFPSFDDHYLGLSEQRMIVLQGPSGYGKTTFARHALFATALASTQYSTGEQVLAFLLEDTERGFVSSYMGYRGIPRRLREPGSSRYMTPEWEEKMARCYAEFMGLPILVDFEHRALRAIVEKVRRAKEQTNLCGVVIDHAQEVEVPGNMSIHEQLNKVASEIAALADEIRTPVVMVSQTTMKDGDYKPQYSDKLRQLADLCEVVTRGNVGCTREEAVQSNIMRVICDKSRWQTAHPVLTLYGEAETGRLWEAEEYAQAQSYARMAGEAATWPGNE